MDRTFWYRLGGPPGSGSRPGSRELSVGSAGPQNVWCGSACAPGLARSRRKPLGPLAADEPALFCPNEPNVTANRPRKMCTRWQRVVGSHLYFADYSIAFFSIIYLNFLCACICIFICLPVVGSSKATGKTACLAESLTAPLAELTPQPLCPWAKLCLRTPGGL